MALVYLGALLCWGCATSPAPTPSNATEESRELPGDIPSLHKVLDEELESTLPTKPALDRAQRAAKKIKALEPEPGMESLWRLAKLAFHQANASNQKDEQLRFAQQGAQEAAKVIKLDPSRVEGHYFSALNTALIAEANADQSLVPQMMSAGKKAAEIEASYDQSGPLRFLGKVYITAPGWPTSVGSTEKGVETLEKAVALAPSFLNRLFLAEAYYHDEQPEKASELLHKLKADPEGQKEPRRWQEELEKYLRLLSADMEDSDDLGL